MGLAIMILGLAIFLGVHLLTTMRPQRAELIGRLGENGFAIRRALALRTRRPNRRYGWF